jgi:hypothetical protein
VGHVVHVMVPFVIWSISCKLIKNYLKIALAEEKREKKKEKHERTF